MMPGDGRTGCVPPHASSSQRADETRDEYQIQRSISKDLIGDVNVIALDVMSCRCGHKTLIRTCPVKILLAGNRANLARRCSTCRDRFGAVCRACHAAAIRRVVIPHLWSFRAFSCDQKLLSHLSEAGAAILTIEQVEYGGHRHPHRLSVNVRSFHLDFRVIVAPSDGSSM